MLYDIGHVDGAGRVASNDIINALHWQPGRLDVNLTPRIIVIRAVPGGPFSVPRRPRIIIPSHARRSHGIKLGDHVLIAAALDYDLVIVYPLSALDEMISRYHAAESKAETPQWAATSALDGASCADVIAARTWPSARTRRASSTNAPTPG